LAPWRAAKAMRRNISKVCSPVAACRRKTPLHNPFNQHKAKIEPGKSFVYREPHPQVKFHKKTGTSIQISVKLKGSVAQLSPGEIPISNGYRLHWCFPEKASPIEPCSSIKTGVSFNNARSVVWFIAHPKKI
jgi:hypothetical protein